MKLFKTTILFSITIATLFTMNFHFNNRDYNIQFSDNDIASKNIISNETIKENMDFIVHKTEKTLPNGDQYLAQKYEFVDDNEKNISIKISIKGTTGTITYFNTNPL